MGLGLVGRVLVLLAAGPAACGAPAAAVASSSPSSPIVLSTKDRAVPFGGVGAISGSGATDRLMYDYPEPTLDTLLDLVWKPQYGAALQNIKVRRVWAGNCRAHGEEQAGIRAPEAGCQPRRGGLAGAWPKQRRRLPSACPPLAHPTPHHTHTTTPPHPRPRPHQCGEYLVRGTTVEGMEEGGGWGLTAGALQGFVRRRWFAALGH
jgi:hypothetical protein